MRARVLLVAVVLVLAGVSFREWRKSRMSVPLAPTLQDLEEAYRTRDPNLAGHQQADAVAVTASGIMVLCSTNPKGEGDHTWLIRLADDGNVRWERHYPSGLGTGRAIAALPDGGFVIAGDLRRSELEFQGSVLRVDAEGGATAKGAFGPRGVTGFTSVAVLGDGSIVAGGTAGWKGLLVRLDDAAKSGREIPLADVEDVYSLSPLADGGFAVAASREKSTTTLGKTRLAAYAADGRVRWQKDLPATGRGEPAALAALPDGGLVAVGHLTASDRDAAQIWVVRVDAAGAVAWERLLGAANEERRGRAVAAYPDGSVAVVGDGLRDGRRGLRVARLAADGAVVWERSYGGEGSEVARGLARTEDGGLVVVGSTMSKGPGKTNAWVLRLDRDGRLLWDRAFGTAG